MGGRKRGKETSMCKRNIDWLPETLIESSPNREPSPETFWFAEQCQSTEPYPSGHKFILTSKNMLKDARHKTNN